MIGELSAQASMRTRAQTARAQTATQAAGQAEAEGPELPRWQIRRKRRHTEGARLPVDFSGLGAELRARIGASLDRSDRVALRETNRMMRTFVNPLEPAFEVGSPAELHEACQRFPSAERVTIRAPRFYQREAIFRDDDLVPLASLSQLKELTCIEQGALTGAGLVHLHALPKFENLRLLGADGLTDDGLSELAHLTGLRCLDLSLGGDMSYLGGELSDAGFAPLRALTQLRELDLSGRGARGDELLGHIGELSMLEKLHLNCATGDADPPVFTDAGMAHIGRLKNLRELVISEASLITSAGIDHLRGCRELRVLGLEQLVGLNGHACETFEALPHLETLDLSYCVRLTDGEPIGDDPHPLARLGSVSNLRRLDLVGVHGLRHDLTELFLPRLANLEELHIDDIASLSAEVVAQISHLGRLRELTAGPLNGMTPALFEHLGSLEELRTLKILGWGNWDLPMASVWVLRRLPHLDLNQVFRRSLLQHGAE